MPPSRKPTTAAASKKKKISSPTGRDTKTLHMVIQKAPKASLSDQVCELLRNKKKKNTRITAVKDAVGHLTSFCEGVAAGLEGDANHKELCDSMEAFVAQLSACDKPTGKSAAAADSSSSSCSSSSEDEDRPPVVAPKAPAQPPMEFDDEKSDDEAKSEVSYEEICDSVEPESPEDTAGPTPPRSPALAPTRYSAGLLEGLAPVGVPVFGSTGAQVGPGKGKPPCRFDAAPLRAPGAASGAASAAPLRAPGAASAAPLRAPGAASGERPRAPPPGAMPRSQAGQAAILRAAAGQEQAAAGQPLNLGRPARSPWERSHEERCKVHGWDMPVWHD